VLFLQEWRDTARSQDWLDRVNAMDAVGCATRHALKELVDEGVQVPISVVGRGVDHWTHIETKARPLPSTKRFRFVHVSDGRPERGVDILLDAFGRVFDRKDDASLLICLRSPAKENDLVMRLKALQMGNADYPEVTIVNQALDDVELKSLVAQCHVYVSPSRLEEFGSGVALAFLCGLPAIVTGWGGQLDYCDSTNSWLLDYDFRYATALSSLGTLAWAEPSPVELEDALWSAYRSTPGDRASKAEGGRSRLMANFTWRHVAERMLKLAASALLARGGAS
jgi:glycosyltransferase involved in cell wall biosynthesis